MRCNRCGADLAMYALSDKPDPGYGYRSHTWEDCARLLLKEAVATSPIDLQRRIGVLLLTNGSNRLVEAARDFAHAYEKHRERDY